MNESAGVGPFDHRAQVEELLGSILRLMDFPARLDFKDMSDGALGVAVHFEGELPGVTHGKRSYLIDCLQFLLNKAINRPNVPRRWVNLGVDAFPEVRPGRAAETPKATAPAPAPATAPVAMAASAPLPVAKAVAATSPGAAAPPLRDARAKAPERPHREPAGRSSPRAPEDGAPVAADPRWTALGRSMAEKAQRHGRVYAIMMLSNDQRAQLIKSVPETKGVVARAEGDGHWRRLAVLPEKVAPLPKKHVMPDWDDEAD
jgi:hypothetical protein